MPNYDGFDMDFLLGDLKFETAAYKLLEDSPVPSSRLLYFWLPVQHAGHQTKTPTNQAGRPLMVFARVKGQDNIWRNLSQEAKVGLSVFCIS
jgi:hypothetical protein